MSNDYTPESSCVHLEERYFLGLMLAAAIGVSMLGAAPARAQAPPGSVEEAVDGLVADALQANLELDGAGATVAQRLAALDQARALYLPSLDL
jgi:outer membrane protein TolC